MLNLFVAVHTFFADMADKLDRDETGATAVEYGIMVALIAAVIVATVGLIGDRLLVAFNAVLTELTP